MFLKNAIARNWKTTSLGVFTAAAGFVAFSPDMFGGDHAALVQMAKFISMGGLASLGIVAKDYGN